MSSSNTNINGHAEIAVSLAAVILGLIICFYLIPTQVLDPSPVIPNAKTFPYVLAGSFTLLCCYWVLDAFRRNTRQESGKEFPRQLIVGLCIGTVFVGFGYLIGTLGYIIGGIIIMVSVIIAIEGGARWRMALVAGITTNIAFVFFFSKLLHIELPEGILTLF